MTTRTALSIMLALGAMGLGCGSPASDFCNAFCDCTNCSEKNYDECTILAEANFDKADVYGCRPEADDVVDCQIRKYRCTGNNFTVTPADCQKENDDLSTCVNSSSALH